MVSTPRSEHDNRNANLALDGRPERPAGGLLALGSLLAIVGGALHPPGDVSIALVTGNATRWIVSHWLFASGSFLVALAALLVLVSRSELADTWYTMASWAGIALGSLLAVVFLVGEAAALPQLAAVDATQRFATWHTYVETGAVGAILPMTLGFGFVAWNHARRPTPRTPSWLAWGALLTFGVGGIGWSVGFGVLGIDALQPLLLLVILGFVWVGWLGVNVVRS